MASITLSQYGKYIELQNVSASADPASAPEGGIYLFASGTSAAPNSARLYLQNEAGVVTDVVKSLDIDAFEALGSATVAQGDDFIFSDDGTEKKISFSNLEDSIFANMNSESSDVAVAAGGAITLANNSVGVAEVATAVAGDGLTGGGGSALAVQVSGALKITSDKVSLSGSLAGTGLTYSGSVNAIGGLAIDIAGTDDIGAALAATDEMHVSDAGTLKRFDVSRIGDFVGSGADFTVSNGALSLADDSVGVDEIATAVAGNGLSGGGGSALAVDLNELGTGASVNVAADSFAFVDADDNSSKQDTIADLVAGIASTGLDAASGQLSVDVSDFMDNGSNNRIITAKDADSMNAEANLTFDGSTLAIAGAMSGSGALQVVGNSSLGGTLGVSGSFTAAGGTLTGNLSGSGGAQFVGGLIVGGASNAFSGSIIADSISLGGGYGAGTGATISSAGRLQINENLTVDGTATIAGGYGAGDGGVSITSIGGLNMDGALQVDGTVTVGANTAGADAKFFGAAADEYMIYSAANHQLQFVDGTGTYIKLGSDLDAGDFGLEIAERSGNNGKVKATAFVTYSDESLKEEVTAMDNALDSIMSLNGVEFTWKSSGERDFGFLAQEVKSVIPQAVSVGSDGIHGVDYSRLTSVLVEAVKAQQVQIEELKAILKK